MDNAKIEHRNKFLVTLVKALSTKVVDSGYIAGGFFLTDRGRGSIEITGYGKTPIIEIEDDEIVFIGDVQEVAHLIVSAM